MVWMGSLAVDPGQFAVRIAFKCHLEVFLMGWRVGYIEEISGLSWAASVCGGGWAPDMFIPFNSHPHPICDVYYKM